MAKFPPPNHQTVTGSYSPSGHRKIPQVLDELSPGIQTMFPNGNLKRKQEEHCIKFDLSRNAVEYWQIQLIKLMSSKGFSLTGTNAVNLGKVFNPHVQYTFGR